MSQPIFEVTQEQLAGLVGRELGTSPWLMVDQKRIDAFADVTEDHQYIHVDVERATATPLGGTIAHGLLTLALIVRLCEQFVPRLHGASMLFNYGFDRVRFVTPVRSGRRIRATARLAEARERGAGRLLTKLDVTIEVEGEVKPAMTAEWLILHVLS
jgi:acyl dehydratase